MVSLLLPPSGNLCMVTGGANLGRIGIITNRERHPGSFDVVHVKDSAGNNFATRLSNIFIIGKVRTRRKTDELEEKRNSSFPQISDRLWER